MRWIVPVSAGPSALSAQSVLRDDGDDQVFLVLQMPEEVTLEGQQAVPEAASRLARGGRAQGLVRARDKAAQQAVERVVIGVQQIEPTDQPWFQPPHLREIDIILDLVMPQQILNQMGAKARQARAPADRVDPALGRRLRLGLQGCQKLRERQIPLQPEGGQP